MGPPAGDIAGPRPFGPPSGLKVIRGMSVAEEDPAPALEWGWGWAVAGWWGKGSPVMAGWAGL